MKRMLVNATQQEELRVAMVDGQKLYDLDIEVPSREQRKANVYKGRITRIEPSLEAAFIDYGAERHGFLPLKEISPEYFVAQPEADARVNIKDVLKEGQEIVVQVEKEERGNKGAALTTFVSLAGRFLVLMPNNPKAGGVSRRITGEDRDVVRDSLDELNPPDNMGCIVRTAGVGREIEELRWDLDYLLKVWDAIKGVVVSRPAPFLIYQEGNAIVRALRDYYSSEIGEILIDDPTVCKDAEDFMARVMPNSLRKLKLYEDAVPLFTRFQIESQIESAYSHNVSLPSGGSIVIDHTEALTAIDINSARSTRGEDIEQTAFNTNLEAAEEVARQLRIRDLGGLVVVDFIDMGPQRNQREVENRLRESVRHDRARIQIGKISRFGLLELSRQRLRPSLEESTQLVCPRCGGNGVVRGVESLALAVLRLVGEEARKDRTAKVIALVPTEVGNYILNEKRDWVQNIQLSNRVAVVIVGDPELETPNYSIRRVRDDETASPENTGSSYGMVQTREDPAARYENSKPAPKPDVPAVAEVLPATPAPIVDETARKPAKPTEPRRSLFTILFGWLTGGDPEPPAKSADSRRRSDTRRNPKPARNSRPSQNRKPRQRSSGNKSGRGGNQPGNAAAAGDGGSSSGGSGSSGGGSGSGTSSGGGSGGGSGSSGGSGGAAGSGSATRGRRRGRRGRGSNPRAASGRNQSAGDGAQGGSGAAPQSSDTADGSAQSRARPGNGNDSNAGNAAPAAAPPAAGSAPGAASESRRTEVQATPSAQPQRADPPPSNDSPG